MRGMERRCRFTAQDYICVLHCHQPGCPVVLVPWLVKKKRIFVFTTATPIINQGKWTCDQQQQKLIGVLTIEETELESDTRLLVLT